MNTMIKNTGPPVVFFLPGGDGSADGNGDTDGVNPSDAVRSGELVGNGLC
jgi:hypothetical protein